MTGNLFEVPSTFRAALDFLSNRDQLISVKTEVDPVYEVAGIEKALDNGPAFLFENIRGYPGVRDAGNVLARMENVAAMFGVDDYRKLKLKCVEAIRRPLPPEIVREAPCQEVVVTAPIDVPAILPIIKHSKDDGGFILGGGVVFFSDLEGSRATDLTFRRIHFRGPDWASIMINPVSHLIRIMRRVGGKIPVTVNIGVSPASLLVAGAWALHTIVPDGADEAGIAGALQGTPLQLIKAKTVNAYALADAEWVLEGYIIPDKVFESEEAEKLGKARVAPFFPEWNGYVGKALIVPKLQVTAITHRKDRPIFYTPLAASFEADHMGKVLREACFIEFARRLTPGLVLDCNIPYGNKVNTGVVFKVKKRGGGDDALVKNLIASALNIGMARLVIAVDDDINVYNPDDIWWAVATRANTDTGIIKAPAGSAATGYQLSSFPGGEGIAIDATSPFEGRDTFKRAHFPVDLIDLRKHFSQEQLAGIRSQQNDWARFMAEIGG